MRLSISGIAQRAQRAQGRRRTVKLQRFLITTWLVIRFNQWRFVVRTIGWAAPTATNSMQLTAGGLPAAHRLILQLRRLVFDFLFI
jgi:hypothetical protein